ncbi:MULTISPECIES: GDSL-type esterase/lipase family protein [Catenuloplanes]|uniref:Lysophospholipase L1-like esterase n=1 Tax=Catenuloplanes niger TaxID=587534 RepID=A0AAE3ZWD4_9ACTN|nr:GDSL-type esterase/lipase family protein [Catenuloplanes niger]MDR7326162.1 lysophospholipase L1-like esterase [Catenuloplanes niger]
MSILKRLAILVLAVLLLPAAPAVAHGPAPGSLADPNLHFAGRWDTGDPGTYVGNWGAPYVTATFTGSTLTARVRDTVSLYVSIDGGADTLHENVRGAVDLTPARLRPGVHTVRLSYRTGDVPSCATWPAPCATFQGFVLGRGERTLPRRNPRTLVEFVGDSITVGALSSRNSLTSYAWQTGERLGADRTNIARSGACLVDIPGTCFGIGANYRKQAIAGTVDWDFSRYRADAVVINLGTNDAGRGVSGADFQAAYERLLREVRAAHPSAHVFALETLRRRYVAETQAAVRAVADPRVHWVSTEGWLAEADYVDGGHPTDAGHAKIAERLAPVVAGHLGLRLAGAPTDPNLTFTGRWDTSDPATYRANWAGSYLTTRYSGATAALLLRGTIDVWVSVDGGPDQLLAGVSGRVGLPSPPSARPWHTLRVAYRNVDGSYRGDAAFQGLALEPGARTAPWTSRRLIEFVGDSITRGSTSSMTTLTSYGWLAGERLGARHTHIAYGGGCLISAADGCAGMRERYFRSGFAADSPPWDFSRYHADAVVINLGTNDLSHRVPAADFQAGYVRFLRDVRAVHPRAKILVLGTFAGRYLPETEAAVALVNDPRTSFVDTTGWLPPEGLTDRVHPNDLGHRLIADRLTPLL